MNVGFSRSASIDFGVSIGAEGAFAETINADAGLNLGFSWSTSVSYSQTRPTPATSTR